MSKMTLNGSNDSTKGVKLHPRNQITLLVGLFYPFRGVILDIGDYTPKLVI